MVGSSQYAAAGTLNLGSMRFAWTYVDLSLGGENVNAIGLTPSMQIGARSLAHAQNRQDFAVQR